MPANDWLNYHHLLYFWTIAREGSVVRAASQLHLSQPTVSTQLHALERSLGHKLFVRRGRSLALTEIGEIVFRYAEEIFEKGRELSQAVHGVGAERPQRFAVGMATTLPKLTAHRLLDPALRLSPAVRLELHMGRPDQLLAELSVHALDMVLSDAPIPPTARVRAFNHLLGECPATLFATKPLWQRYGKGFPKSLHDAPMLLPTPNSAMRKSLDAWFSAKGVAPEVVAEIEDLAVLQSLGQKGLGVFAAPTVVERDITRVYGVRAVGRVGVMTNRFYAISVERKLKHPAVIAICESARERLFAE
ncbi:MAG: LysR family transcriptional regulator [Planctomycetes bacterium]|nr:LysR family transcriptional regulator [Planctomycetota bacterium]